MRLVTIVNQSKAIEVGANITLADTFLTRLVGLLGKKRLDAGCGVLIRPSSGVHTFGMQFAIDVVALDRHLRVVRVWHQLEPCRMTPVSLAIHSMLELSPGKIRECSIAVGDQLEIRDQAHTFYSA